MKIGTMVFAVLMLVLVFGCGAGHVDLTKTGRGFFAPTDPDHVEILVAIPRASFVELATVTTSDWKLDQTAKLHNSLRAKAAPLGADAVVLNSCGVTPSGFGKKNQWCTGVAIRYRERPAR